MNVNYHFENDKLIRTVYIIENGNEYRFKQEMLLEDINDEISVLLECKNDLLRNMTGARFE